MIAQELGILEDFLNRGSQDVTAASQLDRFGFRFDRRTGQFSMMATWTNTGTDSFSEPLQVVIESITPDIVTVVNADGTTPDGRPFFDFSDLVDDGKLDAGETSEAKQLVFNNPSRARFEFDVSFRAGGGDNQDAVEKVNAERNRRLLSLGESFILFRGVVQETTFNNETFTIKAVDSGFKRHRILPKDLVTKEEFRQIRDTDLLNKPIPIIYGRFSPEDFFESNRFAGKTYSPPFIQVEPNKFLVASHRINKDPEDENSIFELKSNAVIFASEKWANMYFDNQQSGPIFFNANLPTLPAKPRFSFFKEDDDSTDKRLLFTGKNFKVGQDIKKLEGNLFPFLFLF